MDSTILSFEEIANKIEINEEQENSKASQLYIGKSFLSWDEGFGYRKAPLEEQHNTQLCRVGCPWYVNINKNDSGYYTVTSLVNEHEGHVLSPDTAHLLPQFWKLSELMLDGIKFWTLEGNIMAQQQYQLLLSKYKQYIGKKDLYNAISQFQYESFAKAFYQCWNRLEVDNFERQYSELVESYPIVQKYLSRVESINNAIKTKLSQRSVTLFEVSKCITKFLQKRQANSEFISWKESMPLISTPNIYNTIFSDVNAKLCTFITLPIVSKIREQMNLSLLYCAKKSSNDFPLKQDSEVDCGTSCLDKVFDLLQVSTSKIFCEFYSQIVFIWEVQHVKYPDIPHFIFLLSNSSYQCTCKLAMTLGWDQFYNSDVDNRQFIQLGNSNNNYYHFPTKWTPNLSIDIHKFSCNEIEQVQSRLKEKQCYAKVFGLAKALVNKTIDLELDKKLIALLEEFKNNEIMPSLYSQHQNNKIQRELTQCKYCGEQGHNIRSCEKKHNDFELESDSSDLESENDNENLNESELENEENQVPKRA
ncbi:12701_t:CDS:2 [Gigaspora rosea]|nr:12701_t:CDS:2 [Gigaspora rosea]